jgi:predicted HicB family RNase H-like nuclease
MEKKKFSSLIDQLKSAQPKEVQQKVIPNKISKLENETQFSFYIDKKLLKKLKMNSVQNEKSIKDLINAAITEYIKQTDD